MPKRCTNIKKFVAFVRFIGCVKYVKCEKCVKCADLCRLVLTWEI